VYHKLASGAVPAPLRLSDPSHLTSAIDGRLVSVRGTLTDILSQPQHTQLMLQSGNTLFEVALDHSPGTPAREDLHWARFLRSPESARRFR